MIGSGGGTSSFSVSSLGPVSGGTVALHDLTYDPSTNELLLLTNGGLFRGPSSGGPFVNTSVVSELHGHEAVSVSTTGEIALGGQADTVVIASGGGTSSFSVSSLGPASGGTVALHDLTYDPLTSELLLLTNGGLFRGSPNGGLFVNTGVVSELHGHEAVTTVPECSTFVLLLIGTVFIAFANRRNGRLT